MALPVLFRFREAIADRGWAQYPPQRIAPRQANPIPLYGRALIVLFSSFWIIVLSLFLLALVTVFGIFIWAAFTS